ncbi:pirin family protein [Flavobacterium anhuiense]|uniref:pirin family protein n=1 Tax=Flavobacterium anhuiense TaxID=459526 RepID=UPI003D985A90
MGLNKKKIFWLTPVILSGLFAVFSFIEKKGSIHIIRASEGKVIDRGKFVIRLLPLGDAVPGHKDHGLYQLGRVDHAALEPGTVVKMHLHHNDEILSYMRKGTMVHTDSKDNKVPIHKQYLMMMNSGSGFYHEEAVADDGEKVEMLQIFIRPRADELTPQVQFYQLDDPYSINKWRLIGGNKESSAPLKINSDIEVYDIRLKEGKIALPALGSKAAYLYVFEGEAGLSEKGELLHKGDAVYAEGEELSLEAKAASDLVLFVMDKKAVFSKNGLYAK